MYLSEACQLFLGRIKTVLNISVYLPKTNATVATSFFCISEKELRYIVDRCATIYFRCELHEHSGVQQLYVIFCLTSVWFIALQFFYITMRFQVAGHCVCMVTHLEIVSFRREFVIDSQFSHVCSVYYFPKFSNCFSPAFFSPRQQKLCDITLLLTLTTIHCLLLPTLHTMCSTASHMTCFCGVHGHFFYFVKYIDSHLAAHRVAAECFSFYFIIPQHSVARERHHRFQYKRSHRSFLRIVKKNERFYQ